MPIVHLAKVVYRLISALGCRHVRCAWTSRPRIQAKWMGSIVLAKTFATGQSDARERLWTGIQWTFRARTLVLGSEPEKATHTIARVQVPPPTLVATPSASSKAQESTRPVRCTSLRRTATVPLVPRDWFSVFARWSVDLRRTGTHLFVYETLGLKIDFVDGVKHGVHSLGWYHFNSSQSESSAMSNRISECDCIRQ